MRERDSRQEGQWVRGTVDERAANERDSRIETKRMRGQWVIGTMNEGAIGEKDRIGFFNHVA